MLYPPVALESPATNVTFVCITTDAGFMRVMFSYGTSVAAWITQEGTTRRYVTKGQTVTTKKHLGQHGPKKYLRTGDHCEEVSSEDLQRLIADALTPAKGQP